MGRRGPQPKPTALRILQGNAGNRPLNLDEPQLPAPPSSIPPPHGLSGAGRKEWIRLAPILVTAGVLSDGDLAHFEDYCRCLSDLRRYETKARRVGLEIAIAKGFAGQIVKLRAQAAQLRSHFGMTPSSRSGVSTKRSLMAPDSKLKAFLTRGTMSNKNRFFGRVGNG